MRLYIRGFHRATKHMNHHIGVFATTQMNYDDPLATFSTLREARDYVQDACLAVYSFTLQTPGEIWDGP